MELRALRYFLAVACEGSITRAANSLHLTQPTLSRQLKELEDELGTKLIYRHSHSVSLTADGMRLRKRAEEIVEMLDKTSAEFARHEKILAGDIYLGCGETRAMSLVADIIMEIRKEYPEICFHIQSGNSQDVTERLDKGLLDFCILIQPADISKYDSVNLPQSDVWGIITQRNSHLAQKQKICSQDLLGIPLLLSRQAITPTNTTNSFIEWFGNDFDKLQVAGTFNLVYNAIILARSGVGHVVSIDGLADVSESSGLCFRPLFPRLETRLDLVWKKHQIFSPAAELFLQKVRSSFLSGDMAD